MKTFLDSKDTPMKTFLDPKDTKTFLDPKIRKPYIIWIQSIWGAFEGDEEVLVMPPKVTRRNSTMEQAADVVLLPTEASME